MHIKKTRKIVKQVEETIDSFYQCDKCDARITSKHPYDCFEMDFKLKKGTCYGGDGGYGDEWEIDLCEECSLELVEKLKSDGYKIRHNEWHY